MHDQQRRLVLDTRATSLSEPNASTFHFLRNSRSRKSRFTENGEQRVHRPQRRISPSEDDSLRAFRIPYRKFARHFRGSAEGQKII
jgi:hypothetical protein